MRSQTFVALLLLVAAAPVRAFSEEPIALPAACLNDVSGSTGLPVFFEMHRGLHFGLSTRPGALRHNAPVALWVYNPTGQEQSIGTCSDLDMFFPVGIDLLSHDGKRLLTRVELTGGTRINAATAVCSRNISIRVPAHSCLHGDLDHPTYDWVRYLGTEYPLQAGQYQIAPRASGVEGNNVAGPALDVTP